MTGSAKSVSILNALYFKSFNEKNLNVLSTIYSPNVILTDWVGEWIGKDNVLHENRKLFQNEFTLTLENTKLFFDEDMGMNRTINDIVIEINGETIKAVDDILFNSNNKIYSITAYKR